MFRDQIDGINYGAVWLAADQGSPAPGRRAIDHLSWRVIDVDQAIAALTAKKVRILSEPGPSPGGNRVAFVEDPAGVRIEIMQRPQ